jgi:hypothetical protein
MSDKKIKEPKLPVIGLDALSSRVIEELQKNEVEEAKTGVSTESGMLGMILKSLKDSEVNKVQRMAFEIDPANSTAGHVSLYRSKISLVPDHIIKKICGPQGDELVCQILQARSNMIASFGRPRPDRFSIGFEFNELNSDLIPHDDEQYKLVQEELNNAKEVLWNCGYKGLEEDFHPNLSQFLKMITRDGLAYGRIAIEFIYARDSRTGEDKIHSFRAVDAGTIYRVMPHKEADKSTRLQAIKILQELKNEKFNADQYKKDEYRWVQVVDQRPVQAFTEKELVIYNLYPTTNVEYSGYPLTPIDQAIHAITTHINITLHNKLYFQNGRAAKGILVFKSDNIDESTIQKIRLQFNQSINSVKNSHRMPVFGVGAEEDVMFTPIETQGRDAEFQYLMDSNARVILSAFQMSPEELPGYSHLSRGSNTQALSEGSNEWKLTAARDVGLRPLLYDIQDLINQHIFPKFFPKLSKSHQLVLAGLDKDDPEKEATRLQEDSPIHMTYDEIMERVEKTRIGKELGGKFPLNPQFQQVIQTYLTFGQILESFFGQKGASIDPRYNFYMNPLWLQWQQMNLQKAQIAMQNQMMQMQQAQQPQGQEQGQDGPPQAPGQPAPTGNEEEDAKKSEQYQKELGEWLQKNQSYLNKSIKDNHNSLTRQILARHDEVTKKRMKEWSENTKKALAKIKSKLKEE